MNNAQGWCLEVARSIESVYHLIRDSFCFNSTSLSDSSNNTAHDISILPPDFIQERLSHETRLSLLLAIRRSARPIQLRDIYFVFREDLKVLTASFSSESKDELRLIPVSPADGNGPGLM